MSLFQLSFVLVVLVQLSQQAAIENRIVNGEIVTSIEEYPYQVSLFKKNQTNNILGYRFYCGGSVISEKYILTAAHCVTVHNTTQKLPAEHIFVIAGKTSVAKFDKQLAHITNKTIVHPNYNLEFNFEGKLIKITNDIALINLKDPLKLSEKINKVRLPKKRESSSWFYGKTAVATGFGMIYLNEFTANLYAVNLTIPEKNKCNQGDDKLICIRQDKKRRGICYGDSGGPLVVNGVQCGVTSSLLPDPDDHSDPHLCHLATEFDFANIIYYRDWISENSDVDEENAE
ncbi:chymotrypsin-2-like [Anthonomus grandis grandis]|uniref:chymotrypsin-2-like n=1 Tax=Anthonomus grandis grandis TaxID=2921223 RepID=UPI002166A21F|nr:chymotrypsin-2-like [Anthonomus grandis grandis]